MSPMMSDWTGKKKNKSYEVWRWVLQKYGISGIVQKFYSIKRNCSSLAVTNDVWLNLQNIEW